MNTSIFNKILKEIMQEKNISQKQLSEYTGIPASSIASWFGKQSSSPSIDAVTKIADFFGCTIDYLVGRESEDGAIVIQQSDSLSENEIKVLDMFRTLNVRRQGLAMVYIAALYDSQVKGV